MRGMPCTFYQGIFHLMGFFQMNLHLGDLVLQQVSLLHNKGTFTVF